MAMRLARWLVQETSAPAPLPKDLEQAVQYHLLDGGFLDWARLSLRSGDPIGELSAAYQKLFGRVTAVRESQSHHFAQLLQNWVELGSGHSGFLPIETILDTIVAPLASQGPVLAIVLDSGMTYTAASEGERWRNSTSAPTDQELNIQGQRVVIPDSHQLIAPWSEKLRYEPKKTGYHGGINPQEMVVPVAVLSSSVPGPKGWAEAPLDTPLWWHPYAPELPVVDAPAAVPSAPLESDHAYLGPLFGLLEPVEPTPTPASPELPLWVSRFLKSPSYQAQKQLAGRLAPDEALLTCLLARFDRQGSAISLVLLARRLNQSPAQLQQLMPSLQRILNIDGYAVLTGDGSWGQNASPSKLATVALNHDLLLQQFGVALE